MQVDYLEFPKAGSVQLKQTEIDESLAEGDLLLKTHLTLVSPGREISAFSGQRFAKAEQVTYPFQPGSVAVGEIANTGPAVKGLKPGDLVLATGRHASAMKLNVQRDTLFKLPEGIHKEDALFLILGILSIVPVRVAATEVGRRVAVVGLGLTGNITAQLFRSAGVDVTGIDVVEKRIQEAIAVGIPHTINMGQEDLKAKTDYLTEKAGFDIVVCDASNRDALAHCFEIAKDYGEVVLMTPLDGPAQFDASTHVYRRCVTLKGAHANYFGRDSATTQGWNISKHLNVLVEQLRDGKLKFRGLITHRMKPQAAATAYKGVLKSKEQYLGVVFQWEGGAKREGTKEEAPAKE